MNNNKNNQWLIVVLIIFAIIKVVYMIFKFFVALIFLFILLFGSNKIIDEIDTTDIDECIKNEKCDINGDSIYGEAF